MEGFFTRPGDTHPHSFLYHFEAADGYPRIGRGHSPVKVSSASSVNTVAQSEVDSAPASVAGTHGPKQDTYRSEFSSLVNAVRGGDISAAQAALSALESAAPATSVTYSPASTPSNAPATASPTQNDLSALFQAVRGGDVAGAQAALGQLEVDVRSTGPHGDHASLQGQIHGRGHGRGHGHQGSNLWSAVTAAFQSQASAPAETTPPLTEPVTEPVTDPVTDAVTNPVTDTVTNPVSDPVTDLIADSVAGSAPATEVPVPVDPETTELLPAVA